MTGLDVPRDELGGFPARSRPAFGMRPTLRFTLAVSLTFAYLGVCISISHVWRGELEDAIGPVMAWVIPIFMAYIPCIVYRRSFEPVAGKDRALNTALVDVTTPFVVTVDADTRLHPKALTYLISRVASRPQDQHVCACAGAIVWFELDKETDWRLESDPASARAAHAVLSHPGWRQGGNLTAVETLLGRSP